VSPGPQPRPAGATPAPVGLPRGWLHEALTALRGRLWPPRRAAWAALFAALVAGLGLHGLLFYARLSSRLSGELDWQAAAALVERDARPGDAVALAPAWAERARQVLPARVSSSPQAPLPLLGFPRYDPSREDLPGVRRVWLLSLPEAPGASQVIAADLAARAAVRDGPQRLGALAVTRLDLRAPLLPLAWLPDRLAGASVRAGQSPCAADGAGVFRCPGSPGARVAREVREIAGLPRPCLHAEPGTDPIAPLVIEFPAVPMGRALRGHTGFIGAGPGIPGHLVVKVDGEEIGAAEQGAGAAGWHAFQLDTTHHTGRAASVTFLVAAAGPGFCFEAMTLP
jgi:hypothetical protein